MGQLSLFGEGRRKREPEDFNPHEWEPVFFAIMAPPEAHDDFSAVVRQAADGHGVVHRLREIDTAHVSLLTVGLHRVMSPAQIAAAINLGSTISAAPFDIRFTEMVSWPRRSGSHALVLLAEGDCVTTLGALTQTLWLSALDRGFTLGKIVPRNFHLTLLYDRAVVPLTRLDRPLRMPAGELVLLHMLYGQGRHEVLGRWPLRG